MQYRDQSRSHWFSLHYHGLRLRLTKPARTTAWALAFAIIVLSLVPAQLRPETPLPHDLEHFGIFFATGFSFALGYRYRNLLLPLFLLSFTAGIELAQLFVPGRHARLGDFLVDAAAVCVGIFIVLLADSFFLSTNSP